MTASTDGRARRTGAPSGPSPAAAPAPAPALIVALGLADLPDAVALSASAGWNQNERDWRLMIAPGLAWGIRAADAQGRARLVASVVALPYGDAFAWVSMVLVLPEFRGRGHASRLLAHALAALAARGIAAILDATPAGRPVYLPLGFVDGWKFRRHRREAAASPPPASPSAATPAQVRPLRDADWPAIAALDRPAFGADREALLRALAARLPHAAQVAERDGRLAGFVLGRDGREAAQIGPLVADDAGIARALLAAALASVEGPVYLDLAERHDAPLLPWLQAQGFAVQRPFTRMLRGLDACPGDAGRVVLVAGPELG